MAEDKLIVALSADIKDLKAKLGEAQDILKGYSKDAENSSKNSSNGFNKVTSSIKGLVGAYIGLQAAQMAVSKAFNTALQLDSIEAAYTQIFKSSEIATLQLERLKGQANELGLSFLDLATAYKTFAGAAYTTGLTLKDTNEIFDAVTNASAQMKLNSEQTQGTLLALSQMISKGTVSMEELRQQLGERLPGAMKIFADGLGVSVEELNKMIASGKVMASDALPKFAARLNEVYKTTQPIEGLQAAVNRLSNTFTNAVSGGAIGKFFELIVNGATKAIGVVENAYKGFQLLVNKSAFQGNQIFDSGVGEINKLFETGGDKAVIQIAELIAEYNKLGKAFGFATEEGKAYLELIKIAGAAQKELLNNSNNSIKPTIKSITTLEEKLKNLKEQYKTTTIGTAEFYKLGKEIQSVTQQLENLKNIGFTSENIKFQMPSMQEQALRADVDISALQEATQSISDFQAQTNLLNSNLTDLAVIGGESFATIQIPLDQLKAKTEEINETMTALSSTIAVGLTGAFEQAMLGTESFGQAFGKMIKQLIARLLAAVAAAVALAVVISIATGGANLTTSLGKLGIKGGFSGLLNLTSGGLMGDAGNRVVSPVGAGAMGQGGTFDLRVQGTELVGVLNNTSAKNNRIR